MFKKKERDLHDRPIKKAKGFSIFIMIIAVLLALFAGLAGFFTDWLWFKDLGYSKVFWTELITKVEIGVPVFLFAVILVKIYLNNLKRGYFKMIESHEIPDAKRLSRTSWVLAIMFGVFAAVFTANNTWMEFLKFMNSTSFNLKEPLYNLDISFYIFKLAFLTRANDLLLLYIIGVVAITVMYYAILLAVRTPDFFEREDSPFDEEGEGTAEAETNAQGPWGDNAVPFKGINKRRAHKPKRKFNVNDSNFANLMHIASGKLTLLGVVFYLMVAVMFFLRQFDLLNAHSGVVYGAGFTEVNITRWVYRAVIVLAVLGAITLAYHMARKEYKKLTRIPLAIVGVLIAGTVVSMAVQSLIVSPDEINKESKYLENNIKYTRYAYGIDDIKATEFPVTNSLTAEDIKNNDQTISNIRINDYEPVQDFYNQTQSIRQYYDFNDVDIDRFKIDGNVTQTYLSAREINEEKISGTWINKHLKYTHGYGVAVSQVDAVTASGQPDIIVKNIPPETDKAELKIERPEIYFGELTNDYIIVNTDEQEFDYPDGNENKYSKYEGTAGIKLNLLNRILFSIKEGSMKLLVSSNVNSDSRIVINRNVVDRVSRIMPYLAYEKDPYLTIADGKLYWIIDAYTSSTYYPYSEPYSGETYTDNYVRNSVKVVVDAYNGDVSYYVIDENEPIAQTLMKIYPTLFKKYSEMPDAIREHVRYPNTLLRIQSKVYTKYHMNEVKVFYQNEDLWDVSHQIYGTEDTEMNPSYYIFKLPDSDEAEFINMIPFTPKSKQNMTAIMMARNDGKHYGELVVYKFPKNKTVYGPMQIEAQIDQSTEISKEFSLWNSSGSKYRRGDMFVIPIEDSIMYVEPVYLEAANQAIPEVKRVIVAYGDQIAYESTLAEALEDIFGDDISDKKEDQTSGDGDNSQGSKELSTKELIEKANEAYNNAVASQREGDWEKYGKYLKQLESYLHKLENK